MHTTPDPRNFLPFICEFAMPIICISTLRKDSQRSPPMGRRKYEVDPLGRGLLHHDVDFIPSAYASHPHCLTNWGSSQSEIEAQDQ